MTRRFRFRRLKRKYSLTQTKRVNATGVYEYTDLPLVTNEDLTYRGEDIADYPSDVYTNAIKKVFHVKSEILELYETPISFLSADSNSTFTWKGIPAPTGDQHIAIRAKFPFVEEFGGWPSGCPWSDLAGATNAITGAWDVIPEDTSILNSLIELRDIRRLGSAFLHAWDIARGLRIPSSKPISELLLEVHFGAVPLINDLIALWNVSDRAVRRIQFLRDTYGRKVTLAGSNVLTDPYPLESLTSSTGFSTWTVLRRSHEYTYVVGCKMQHKINGLDDVSAHARVVLSKLGVFNPLRVAWNAIPYSFVVDWVYDIGRLMSAFQIPVFDDRSFVLTDPWHSFKVKGACDLAVKPGHASNPVHRIGKAQFTGYKRFSGLPANQLSTLTQVQQALLVALIHVKLPSFGGI